MRETKLVNLLRGLSSDDMRQMRKMLNSPFFTTNKNLLALFNLMKAHHPAYESNRLEKRTVFKKLFPGRAYSDIKLRNLNSELVHVIEDYLIYKSVNKNEIDRHRELMKIYKGNGQFEWFENVCDDRTH